MRQRTAHRAAWAGIETAPGGPKGAAEAHGGGLASRPCRGTQQDAHPPAFSGSSGAVRASFPQARWRSRAGLQEQSLDDLSHHIRLNKYMAFSAYLHAFLLDIPRDQTLIYRCLLA
jgi:hypothetical protein